MIMKVKVCFSFLASLFYCFAKLSIMQCNLGYLSIAYNLSRLECTEPQCIIDAENHHLAHQWRLSDYSHHWYSVYQEFSQNAEGTVAACY